jgi:ATP-dependent Lon protease
MEELDRKIKEIFYEEYVYKDDRIRSFFSGLSLPSFIKDWILRKFLNPETDTVNENALLSFLETYIPQEGDKVKGILISNQGKSRKFLSRILVQPDVKSGEIRFSVPELGIKFSETLIPRYLVREHPSLAGGEHWGVLELTYVKEEKKGYIELTDFRPFKPYKVNLDFFIHARKHFSLEEWVDLLLRSMEYNPGGFDNFEQKLYFLLRLLVFVEPNLNLVELAPKGTGKSYVFNNLSKYGWLISGGFVSRAKLFFDMSRNTPGLVERYDFIAIDEVQTIRFSDPDEIRGALKSYLENGTFTIGNYRGTGLAGFILLGNIPIDSEGKPLNRLYFEELPEVFRESALIDRFHGFIEGWNLPRMHEGMKVKGYALNVEYFSDVLHLLRKRGEYSAFMEELVEVKGKVDTRDKKAILKIATALLKILYPDALQNSPSKEEIGKYCLEPAKNLRRIVKEQLSLLDPEFKPEIPIIYV